jgi:hypothetical protein
MLSLRKRLTLCVLSARCLPRPAKVAILAVLGLLAASSVALAIYQLTGENSPQFPCSPVLCLPTFDHVPPF